MTRYGALVDAVVFAERHELEAALETPGHVGVDPGQLAVAMLPRDLPGRAGSAVVQGTGHGRLTHLLHGPVTITDWRLCNDQSNAVRQTMSPSESSTTTKFSNSSRATNSERVKEEEEESKEGAIPPFSASQTKLHKRTRRFK